MRLASFVTMVMVWGVAGSVPSTAWAGGGSTGGSDGGAGSDTGSGGSSSSDSGPAESTGDDSCGSCQEPIAPVAFTSPTDGAEVPADATVTFEVGYDCSCDDCGCYEDQASSFTVTVDDVEVMSCFDGCTGTQSLDLQLSPGSHELRVTAEYSFHSESASITVTVAGNGGGSSGATAGSDEGGTGSGGGNGGGKGGCRVGGPSEGVGVAALLLLVLGVMRRRGRRRVG